MPTKKKHFALTGIRTYELCLQSQVPCQNYKRFLFKLFLIFPYRTQSKIFVSRSSTCSAGSPTTSSRTSAARSPNSSGNSRSSNFQTKPSLSPNSCLLLTEVPATPTTRTPTTTSLDCCLRRRNETPPWSRSAWASNQRPQQSSRLE